MTDRKDQLDYLKVRAAMGRISRREFFGRTAALGLTAGLANTLLADAVHAAGPSARFLGRGEVIPGKGPGGA